MPLRKDPKSTNRQRLGWAVFRIFIALTSISFFLVFLVQSVNEYIAMQSVKKTADVYVNVIEWITLSADEVELTYGLARNVNQGFAVADDFSYDGLQKLQDLTEVALDRLISSADAADMTTDAETLHLTRIMVQYDNYHAYFLNHRYTLDWDVYFNFTDLMHDLRLALLDIIATNVNYRNEDVARYCITLTAFIYYRENIALLRDALLKMKNYTGLDQLEQRDRVVEYNKAVQIYFREISQRIPDVLQEQFKAAISNPEVVNCNDVLKTVLMVSHNISSFVVDINQTFYCSAQIMYSVRPVRNAIKELLFEALRLFYSQITASLVLAVIGVVLEGTAAGTLIFQAVPVILLYFKFTSVVKSATAISGSSTHNGNSLQMHHPL